MPINESPVNAGFWMKVGLYVLGVLLGIVAKLATMSRTQSVTRKEGLMEISIALAAAYFVWALFHYRFKEDELAIIASVIVGRFGDKLLLSAFDKLEIWLSKKGNEKL